MDCRDFLDRYSDYDDSLLPPAEEAEFRSHLAACEACARYDRVLRKGRMLARQLDPQPSPDFMPRLQRRILTAPARRPVVAGPVAAGGFLTLALVAVAGFWLVDGQRTWQPASVHAAVRPTSLPAATWVGPEDWTVGRVDRRSPSSYSPVVIGPPAYAGDRSVSTELSTAPRTASD